MHDQASNLFIVLSAVAYAVALQLFDVPPHMLGIALLGSAGGIALTRPSNPWHGLLWVISGVVLTGWSLPVLSLVLPFMPAKSIAGIFSLVLIGFRHKVIDKSSMLVDEIFETGRAIIRRWRPGSGSANTGDKE